LKIKAKGIEDHGVASLERGGGGLAANTTNPALGGG
jgi:hypothetical protein